jgi:hypothetical protein
MMVEVSKESKGRDRWNQLNASAHTRAKEWCPGCGYFRLVNDAHRDDCSAINRANNRSAEDPT